MQRLDRLYILLGLVWVVVGMVFGAWLGASDNLQFRNSHAHVNLLGFVTSVLFGLLHWAYASLRKSRLALAQLAIYQIGVVMLVIGKIYIDQGTQTILLELGSVVTIVGAAMMLVMFVKHEWMAKTA